MTAIRLPCFRGCLLLFLLLGTTNFCQGRIGDTLEEEIARYGKPVHQEASEDFAMFRQAPYYITVHFHEKKTDAITYVKAGAAPENVFSGDEIERLLRINGGDRNWEESKTAPSRPQWKTDDKALQAVYSESKFLVITTAAYLARLQAAEKKTREKKTAAKETEQKSESPHRAKGNSGKKSTNPSPKKSPTPTPKKSATSSAKKNATSPANKSSVSSAKKNTTPLTKKSATPSTKKSATSSAKKSATPAKKSPTPSEEHGD